VSQFMQTILNSPLGMVVCSNCDAFKRVILFSSKQSRQADATLDGYGSRRSTKPDRGTCPV
jgi:hypothetical protein